jgi:putative ABC transport system permease protein
LHNIKFGLRMLAKSPGFTIVAVLTLALGVGANAAIFSIINAVLLHPLPYKNAGRLVAIMGRIEGGPSGGLVSYTKFLQLVRQATSIENVGAYYTLPLNLTTSGEPQQINGVRASAGVLSGLGIQPAKGRGFSKEEDAEGGRDVAVITDAFWHNHLGGDPAALGKPISLDGNPTVIVGILPPQFRFPMAQPEPEVWLARPFEYPALGAVRIHSGAGYLSVIARLREGETMQRLQEEADRANASYKQEFPGFADASKFSLSVTTLEDSLVGTLRPSLLVLLAAVGLVLLIACANVASLLLARATTRKKEMALRVALGANWTHLGKQLLAEGLLLSFIGGAAGVLIAWWALPLLIGTLTPGTLPGSETIHVNASVLMFSLAICFLTGIGFALGPIVQAARAGVYENLKEGGRGSSEGGSGGRSRELMVTAEVALALVLMTGAGLLIRSFATLMSVKPGFDSSQVLTFPFSLASSKYSQPVQRTDLYRQFLERVQNIPAVEAAGMVSMLPLSGTRYVFFCAEGMVCQGLGKDPTISTRDISPGYFRTLRIPLLAGRTFTAADVEGSPRVAVINQTTARRYFADVSPLGRHIANSRDRISLEIVGVVGDVKFNTLSGGDSEEMFLPAAQNPPTAMTLVVRSSSNAEPLVAAVRRKAMELDPDLPLSGIQTMDQVVSFSVAQPRLTTRVTTLFAGMALLLAAIGIYGLLAYSVAQRSHEIAIRMAVGAQAVNIYSLVFGQGMKLITVGVAVGLLASFAVTRMMSSLLYGTSATDPATLAAAVFAFLIVGLAACYFPARRATQVDAIVALRG